MQVFKNQKRSSLQMVNLFVGLFEEKKYFISIEIIYIDRLGCLC